VVASLAGGAPLDLGEIACRMDRANLALLLAAIAHAGGSHQHGGIDTHEDGTYQLVQLDSLYPWPAPNVPTPTR
jgi:hypothetical protein